MSRNRKLFKRRALYAIYLVVMVVSFVGTLQLRALLSSYSGLLLPLLPETFDSVYAIIIIWALSFAFFAVHHHETLDVSSAFVLLKAQLLAAGTLFAFIFLGEMRHISRSFILLFLSSSYCLLLLTLLAWDWLRARSMRLNPAQLLVVGTDARAQRLVQKLQKNAGWHIAGFVSSGSKHQKASNIQGIPVRGTINDLPRLLADEVIDEVLFVLPPGRLPAHNVAFSHCEERGIPYRIAFEPMPNTRCDVHIDEINGVPLLTFSRGPVHSARMYLKRGIDIIGAVLMLGLLSPLFLMIWALLRLSGGGSAIYVQSRLGKNGRRFSMFKFRTMVAGADAQKAQLLAQSEVEAPFFKMRNDPRITKLGRVLRKWSLDELPQLFNVLQGDMSLVGPRPILPDELTHFKPWQRRRLSITPGLTGLCQVKSRNTANFQERIEWDLRYIDNWSLALDLKILLWTVPQIVVGHDAH